MTLPNVIIVGAAKAGTTAFYWYLAEHPQVFMSRVKETNFFAYGVDAVGQPLYGDPEVHHFPVKSLSEYERLFADAGPAAVIGEASPIYLECPGAAARMRDLVPGARIICSLRQPVDRAYSDYLMYLRHRGLRFDAARDLSSTAFWAHPDSRWMQIGRYHEQLCRYFEAFPRTQIQVHLFDDLKRDPVKVAQDVYRFVGVDPTFTPDVKTPHAIGGIPSSRLVERLLTDRKLGTLVKPWLPLSVAHWVRRLRARNMEKAPALPPDLRRQLTAPLRQDIIRTSRLLGRSLDHWL